MLSCSLFGKVILGSLGESAGSKDIKAAVNDVDATLGKIKDDYENADILILKRKDGGEEQFKILPFTDSSVKEIDSVLNKDVPELEEDDEDYKGMELPDDDTVGPVEDDSKEDFDIDKEVL